MEILPEADTACIPVSQMEALRSGPTRVKLSSGHAAPEHMAQGC